MALALKDFSKTGAAFVVAFAAAANMNSAFAGGLEPGKCYPKDVAAKVLKDEGQVTVLMGNRFTGDDKNNNMNIFTVNDRGYGYNIEGNKPQGKPQTELCVGAAYKDAQLNSPDNPKIPAWALDIKPNVDVAGGSGSINVAEAYKKGNRLLLHASSYRDAADGSERVGKRIVVALAKTGWGAVWSVDSKAIPDGMITMDNVSVTQHMAKMITVLSSPERMAAYTPK